MNDLNSGSRQCDLLILQNAEQPGPRALCLKLESALILVFLLLAISGCRGPNHYLAEKMPASLRMVAQTNTQEVDLSRLASATGGSETIGPGDLLEVAIAAGLSDKDRFVHPIRVADDGTINLPDIGVVSLAGYPPEAADSIIRGAAINKQLYQNPSVTVKIVHARMNRVKVLGAVKSPGTYELPPTSSDVVSAIAAAGGLAEDAGENVEVRNPTKRGQSRETPSVAGGASDSLTPVSSTSESTPTSRMNSYTLNLISAAKEGDGSYVVQDNGVIMVEKRDPAPIQVLGLVKKPGTYPLPIGKEMSVLGAIAEAGGVSNQLANKIYIIRPLANSADPAVIQVSMRQAVHSGKSNVILGPGDIVKVEQTPATVLLEALQIIRFGISGSLGTFF